MIVDAHIDLAWCQIVLGRDYRRSAEETRRLESGRSPESRTGEAVFGWPDCLRGGVGVIVATLFASPDRLCSRPWETQCYADPEGAHRMYSGQLDLYHRLADAQPDAFCILGSAADLEAHLSAWQAGQRRLGIVILMEGADPIREPSEVEHWVERGVRWIGPAWGATRYAGSASEPGPLTPDGERLLDRMQALGLVLDLSHMAEQAAWQALDRYTGTVVASHSNPRALLPGVDMPERHLSDDSDRRDRRARRGDRRGAGEQVPRRRVDTGTAAAAPGPAAGGHRPHLPGGRGCPARRARLRRRRRFRPGLDSRRDLTPLPTCG